MPKSKRVVKVLRVTDAAVHVVAPNAAPVANAAKPTRLRQLATRVAILEDCVASLLKRLALVENMAAVIQYLQKPVWPPPSPSPGYQPVTVPDTPQRPPWCPGIVWCQEGAPGRSMG